MHGNEQFLSGHIKQVQAITLELFFQSAHRMPIGALNDQEVEAYSKLKIGHLVLVSLQSCAVDSRRRLGHHL